MPVPVYGPAPLTAPKNTLFAPALVRISMPLWITSSKNVVVAPPLVTMRPPAAFVTSPRMSVLPPESAIWPLFVSSVEFSAPWPEMNAPALCVSAPPNSTVPPSSVICPLLNAPVVKLSVRPSSPRTSPVTVFESVLVIVPSPVTTPELLSVPAPESRPVPPSSVMRPPAAFTSVPGIESVSAMKMRPPLLFVPLAAAAVPTFARTVPEFVSVPAVKVPPFTVSDAPAATVAVFVTCKFAPAPSDTFEPSAPVPNANPPAPVIASVPF